METKNAMSEDLMTLAPPVGPDGGHLEAVGRKPQLARNLARAGGGVLGARGGGANEEALLAVGGGGLDDRVGFARVLERSAHLLDAHLAGVMERDGGASDELDAEVEPAYAHHGEARHHEDRRDGEKHLAVAEEVDVMFDEAALIFSSASTV